MSRYLILYYRPGGAGPWRECPHCTRLLSNSRNLGKSECIYLVLTATSLIHSSRSHSLPRNMKIKVRDLAWPCRGQHHCTTRQLQLQPGQVINCPVSKFWVRSFITQRGHTHLRAPTFTTQLYLPRKLNWGTTNNKFLCHLIRLILFLPSTCMYCVSTMSTDGDWVDF